MYGIAAAAAGHNQSMISAIINLVCPQCGGGMMEFRCLGKCSRDWRPEWKSAIKASAILKVQSRKLKMPVGAP